MEDRHDWRGKDRMARRVFQCVASAVLSIALVWGATYLPHVTHTTVALALVLLTLVLSMNWGWVEALMVALVGGLVFDFFYLPPRGLRLEAPERWVTLAAFLLTATTTSQISARAARNRAEAERRRDEMVRLLHLSSALLESDNMDGALESIGSRIMEIFHARAAVFFDAQRGRVFAAGPTEDCLAEDKLRRVAATGNPLIEVKAGWCVVPIHHGGNLAGSLGIAGISLTRGTAEAIAERVGVVVARTFAAEKSMEAEVARRSDNLKSAVLDALAHEIKGPLATVKVSVSTLLSQQPGDALQQRELLAIIDEEADRMERWIDDAIQVSRSEAGQLRLNKQPNSMRSAAERALEGLGPLGSARRIEVRIPDGLPDASFDAEMVEKVIRLILDNALKYSPPGSPVVLSAEFTGAEIVLSVEDRGPGIPEDERERIFESYYRGSSARQGPPGTGLGLASARCIMQAHGGEIWVTGATGVGSVFHISLPAILNAADQPSPGLECGR